MDEMNEECDIHEQRRGDLEEYSPTRVIIHQLIHTTKRLLHLVKQACDGVV